MTPMTPDEVRRIFERLLSAAIEHGEYIEINCSGIDQDTFAAIKAVAREFPTTTDASIARARKELELQLDGTHWREWDEARQAIRDSVIPSRREAVPRMEMLPKVPGQTQKKRFRYTGEVFFSDETEPDDVRKWIAQQRAAAERDARDWPPIRR